MIPCIVFGCKVKLSKLSDMTTHYNQYHFHTCSECNRCYPNERLLSLHISELHDSYFYVMSLKKPSYVCLVDGCNVLSISDEARTLHLKNYHLFPKSFQFHHPIRKKKKKNKSKGLATAITSDNTDEMNIDKEKGSSNKTKLITNNNNNTEGSIVRGKKNGLTTTNTSDNTDEMNIDKDIDASDNNDMIIDDLVASFDNNVSLKIPSHISFGRKHKKGFVRERERERK